MSQNLHFFELKGFDEALIEYLGFESTLEMLSRYYLINDKFWQCIIAIISQEIEKSDKDSNTKQLHQKDLETLEKYQKKNMLIVDAS